MIEVFVLGGGVGVAVASVVGSTALLCLLVLPFKARGFEDEDQLSWFTVNK